MRLWLRTAIGWGPASRTALAGFFLKSEMLMEREARTVSMMGPLTDLLMVPIVAPYFASRKAPNRFEERHVFRSRGDRHQEIFGSLIPGIVHTEGIHWFRMRSPRPKALWREQGTNDSRLRPDSPADAVVESFLLARLSSPWRERVALARSPVHCSVGPVRTQVERHAFRGKDGGMAEVRPPQCVLPTTDSPLARHCGRRALRPRGRPSPAEPSRSASVLATLSTR